MNNRVEFICVVTLGEFGYAYGTGPGIQIRALKDDPKRGEVSNPELEKQILNSIAAEVGGQARRTGFVSIPQGWEGFDALTAAEAKRKAIHQLAEKTIVKFGAEPIDKTPSKGRNR